MRTVGISGHQNAPDLVWRLLSLRLPALLGTPPFRGISSLAAGADQRFAERVVELGGDLVVVIPSASYGDSFEEPEQRAQFERLLALAAETEQMDYDEPGEEAYLAAGQRVVDRSDMLVAVWDGQPAQGKGGTGDVVAYAHRQGKPVEVIWPEGVAR